MQKLRPRVGSLTDCATETPLLQMLSKFIRLMTEPESLPYRTNCNCLVQPALSSRVGLTNDATLVTPDQRLLCILSPRNYSFCRANLCKKGSARKRMDKDCINNNFEN